MSSTYNGSSAAITPHLAVAITEPDDGDPAAVSSVNIAFSKLADYLQWLQQQAALVDSVNGFSVEQAFTAAGSVILLNNALGQIISKIGGGALQIDNSVGVLQLTSGVGSNAILRSGAAGATLTATPTGLTASMPLAMSANAITGVADPGAAQDAATKNYVDGLLPSVSWTVLSLSSDWSGANAKYFKSGRIAHLRGEVTEIGDPAGALIGFLPSGYRPAIAQRFVIARTDPADDTYAVIEVATTGYITITSTYPIVGQIVDLSGIHFPADGS